ncbi:MAG: ComF family protein [Chlamydiae bacterium]|nr:ComF family protein [Chlamydiota bacterium]MBI3267319.1 ComF family protein [Chlamydiota bacterium]
MTTTEKIVRGVSWPFLDLLFPRHCEGCAKVMPHERRSYLCEGCFSRIPWVVGPTCRICAKIFQGLSGGICSACRNSVFSYESCFSAARYDGLLKDLLQKFKFQKAEYLAGTLQKIFWEGVKKKINFSDFDFALPAPLHPRKLKERGFNQALILAKEVSHQSGLPLFKRGLIRQKYSGGQTLQDRKARLENIQDSFRVGRSHEISGKKLLLVDDVLTTGATVRECTRVLKEAGASAITVAVLARSM